MAVGTIFIDGEIIPDNWIWEGDTGVTSLLRVRNQITALGEFDELKVFIFSPGGFCSEGWAIYDYLLALGKKITTIAYGQCASIATVIYMAGSVRQITPNCDFMVHLPWGEAWGNKHDFQNYLDELIIESDKIQNLYSSVTGIETAELDTMLLSDYHMTGQLAVEKKFATELLAVAPVAVQASARNRKIVATVAYLRVPKNTKLKETVTGVPRETVKVSVQNKVKNALSIMPKEKLSEVQKGLNGIKNLLAGRPYSALDVNIDGGQVLVIDVQGDSVAVGDPATIGGNPAPNADYTATEDKTVYSVVDGKISAVTAPADPAANADLETLQAENEDLKQQISVLTAKETGYKKALTESARLLGAKISPDVPVNTVPAAVVSPAVPGVETENEAGETVYTETQLNDPSATVRAKARAYLKAQKGKK